MQELDEITQGSGEESQIPVKEGKSHVDAICISQRNIHERDCQANQMAQIYEQATRVIVWRGASEASSKLAMELISSFQGGTQFIQPSTDPKVLAK
jgi:hypothetical protein